MGSVDPLEPFLLAPLSHVARQHAASTQSDQDIALPSKYEEEVWVAGKGGQ